MTPQIKQRIDQIRRGEVPEGYKKTKSGIIPTKWTYCTISDCLEKMDSPVDVEPNTLYTQIGIRSHGMGLFYKEPISGKELGNKAVFWIIPNCFILNIVFAWEQAIGKTTEKERGMIGSHRFPMYHPINDAVDIDYLLYHFMTKRGTDILEAASPGGAGRNRTLGQDRFMKSKILLPSIGEQKKIAEILSTQDKLIALKEKLIEEKRRRKKYLMQQLLTGKKRLPGFSGEWIDVKLGDVFSERVETNNQNLELLSVTGTNGVVPRSTIDIKDNSSEDKSKYLKICKGDIGYNTMRMWQGVSALSDYEGIVSPAYTILIPDEKISSEFFAYLFKMHTVIFLFYRFSQGIVDDTRSLKYYEFAKLHLTIPAGKEEQEAIAKILTVANKELDLLKRDLDQEKQKKKALMQLLLSGVVRVNV